MHTSMIIIYVTPYCMYEFFMDTTSTPTFYNWCGGTTAMVWYGTTTTPYHLTLFLSLQRTTVIYMFLLHDFKW